MPWHPVVRTVYLLASSLTQFWPRPAISPSQRLGTAQGLAQANGQPEQCLPVLDEGGGGEQTRQFNCMDVSDDMPAGLGAGEQLLVHCIC